MLLLLINVCNILMSASVDNVQNEARRLCFSDLQRAEQHLLVFLNASLMVSIRVDCYGFIMMV